MDGWINEWGWIIERMNEWLRMMHGWINEWMNEDEGIRMDGWMNE